MVTATSEPRVRDLAIKKTIQTNRADHESKPFAKIVSSAGNA